MTMVDALTAFQADYLNQYGKKIPFERFNYTGNENTYITFQLIDCVPIYFNDNSIKYFESTYDVDLYSKNDLLELSNFLMVEITNSGFNFQNLNEQYENETKYFHHTLTFTMEE